MSTVKISWGARIAILYGGFVVLIATLVTMSMKQDFELVSSEYYKDELAYQNTIDADRNRSTLSAPATVSASATEVTIHFPAEFAGSGITGSVHFYCPAAAKSDRKFQIDASGNDMHISRNSLVNERYIVKLNWSASGKNYYQETDLNLH